MIRTVSILLLLALPSAPVRGGYPESVLADGPTAYYRMEASVVGDGEPDVSGNGLHGVWRGLRDEDLSRPGPRPAAGFTDFNPANRAVAFFEEGRASYLSVPDHPQLEADAALTLEAWIRPTDFSQVDAGILAKWRNEGANPDQRSYLLKLHGDRVRLAVSGDGTSGGIRHATTLDPVPADAWTHVAGTYSPSTGLRLYLNGVLASVELGGNAAAVPARLYDGSAPLWVGVQYQTGSDNTHFKGLIDEAAVYGRVLDTEEIRSRYVTFAPNYQAWIADVMGATGPAEDVNGNGTPNLLEYWAGVPHPLDPMDVAPMHMAGEHLRLRQRNGSERDLVAVVQRSFDLREWRGLGYPGPDNHWRSLEGGVTVESDEGGQLITFQPGAPLDRMFYRMHLTLLEPPDIHHWFTVAVPEPFLASATSGAYGGDIRVGELNNDGELGFVVYRANASEEERERMKPVFIGAFDQSGRERWSVGSGGGQPARPGPVAVHDIDGDGATEVIHFWKVPGMSAPADSMADVAIHIRDAATGALKLEKDPEELPAEFRGQRGEGANWVHQRIMVCNLRGTDTPRDFVVKLGSKLFAFDQNLDLLWSYDIPWNTYPNHSAYIPAVGDIDGDGRDEVTGGRYLLDDDGSTLFTNALGPNMDSVAIATWVDGSPVVMASAGGHLLDAEGDVVLALGVERVPHGQEARLAPFIDGLERPQWILRNRGHTPNVIWVDHQGRVLREWTLNSTPNEVGLEALYWHGFDRAALLYNGGKLWRPADGESWDFPGLPAVKGHFRMGWYHLIPADLDGDGREEAILYNPWDDRIHVYGSRPMPGTLPLRGYVPTARQVNVRLMD